MQPDHLPTVSSSLLNPLLVFSFFFSAPMPPLFSSHVAFVFSTEPTLFKPCLCPSSHSGRLRSGLTLCANREIQHQSPTHPMSFCAGQQPQPHKRRLFFRVRIKVATGALVYFLMGHHSPSAWASGELPATINEANERGTHFVALSSTS